VELGSPAPASGNRDLPCPKGISTEQQSAQHISAGAGSFRNVNAPCGWSIKADLTGELGQVVTALPDHVGGPIKDGKLRLSQAMASARCRSREAYPKLGRLGGDDDINPKTAKCPSSRVESRR